MRLPALLAALAVLGVAAGCSSGGGSSSQPTASNSGVVPPSVGSGQKVSFGQSAMVTFTPTPKRSTRLQLTVTGVRTGRIRDLAAYQLDDAAKASTPYYVRVAVTNIGTGDVGGSAIPLYAVSSANAVVGASGFTNGFAKCRSGPLRTPFPGGAAQQTCLMFLLPQGATLTGVTSRSAGKAEPVTWTGTVKPPRTAKK